ncbi:MAG: hypothetical protein NVSMB32_00550 [Actinomycetota bacterium]
MRVEGVWIAMDNQPSLTSTGRNQPVPTGTQRDEKILQEFCERALEVTRLLAHHQGVVADLARQRRQLIVDLRALGLSHRHIAGALGVSYSRVAQIEEDARAHPGR